MSHSLPLITTLATALGIALIMGFIAIKLKLPTLVGYLVAGIILGPFTPGFVANAEIAAEFAEMGIMLLMFGVGLHFSMDNLLETRKIALPGALIQIVIATLLGAGVGLLWGWTLGTALVFGLALSVASTVVLIRALESEGLLGSINGQIAIGWLIVEDIAMIIVLVFLPLMAACCGGETTGTEESFWVLLGINLIKISSFVLIMLLIGRRILPKILWHIIRTGSRELFTLCVITVAVSIAFGASKLFGISLALGAFFAGMIIRESKFSRRAAEESLPFRDAFAVLFFVSVGMLFNPYIFVEQPLKVLAVVGIIVVGKSIAATTLVLAFRYPVNIALTVSASLAQIGEFSFILAGLGVQLKLLPVEAQELILAGALISMAINPLVFKAIVPIQNWLSSRSPWIQDIELKEESLSECIPSMDQKYLSGQVVLVGYGRIGKRIETILAEHGIPYVVVEQNRLLIEQLKRHKATAILGSASEASVLMRAHIVQAGMLVVTTSDIFNIRQMIKIARSLNPRIEIAIRSEDEEEVTLLEQEIDGIFFMSEEELAKGMSQHILSRFGLGSS